MSNPDTTQIEFLGFTFDDRRAFREWEPRHEFSVCAYNVFGDPIEPTSLDEAERIARQLIGSLQDGHEVSAIDIYMGETLVSRVYDSELEGGPYASTYTDRLVKAVA